MPDIDDIFWMVHHGLRRHTSAPTERYVLSTRGQDWQSHLDQTPIDQRQFAAAEQSITCIQLRVQQSRTTTALLRYFTTAAGPRPLIFLCLFVRFSVNSIFLSILK
jgi:hypothetical protein